MHLLTAINNNYEEWTSLCSFDHNKPRLPLCYALAGGFLTAGHEVSAIEFSRQAEIHPQSQFKNIYYKHQLANALTQVDAALLWGGNAQKALISQFLSASQERKILYFSYVLSPDCPTIKQRLQDRLLISLSARALGMVFMTEEQACKAINLIGDNAPIIQFRCGLDTGFYQHDLSVSDIPSVNRQLVDWLMREPYIIMPGDELRLNNDALNFVERTGIRLVRISQYGHKSGTEWLKQEIKNRGLEERCIVFEKISYKFLRFLFRHACAYAGFVDSSWQPAGWTVACEALASGLPIVLYDGLTSRELVAAGVPPSLLQIVEMRDINSFSDRLEAYVNVSQSQDFTKDSMRFARYNLDFSITAPKFVSEIARVLSLR